MSEEKIAELVQRTASAIGGPAGAHEPDWTPLEAALPIEECGGFMFMGYAHANNGESIRLYKHGITRHYLILDEQVRPYTYTTSGVYVLYPWGLEAAINRAFEGIDQLGATRATSYNEDFRATRDAALAAAGWKVVSANVGERP